MGNYPPGTSASDPRAPWNAPDHSHEHLWESEEAPIDPIIEDGAAIFHEECRYAEGQWGQGWQCEETRSYRFEYSTVEINGEEIDVPPIGEWDDLDDGVAGCVLAIEDAYHRLGPGDEVSFDADPDPENGVVTIEWHGYVLKYEP